MVARKHTQRRPESPRARIAKQRVCRSLRIAADVSRSGAPYIEDAASGLGRLIREPIRWKEHPEQEHLLLYLAAVTWIEIRMMVYGEHGQELERLVREAEDARAAFAKALEHAGAEAEAEDLIKALQHHIESRRLYIQWFIQWFIPSTIDYHRRRRNGINAQANAYARLLDKKLQAIDIHLSHRELANVVNTMAKPSRLLTAENIRKLRL